LTLPITEESKQEEWETVITMAKNNGYPIGIINALRTKLISMKHKPPPTVPYNKRKWVTFNCYTPMIRRITNLFKYTDLNIAFGATNTLQQQLSENRIIRTHPSGIYKLKCNACNKAYVGQSGRFRHKTQRTDKVHTN
jgi:hypothetical protein